MNIVIIGSKGQLGSDCCKILAKDNDITGCDLPQIDIGSQTSVDAYLGAIKPDVIINCAAYTAVDACEEELHLSWKVNAEGPKHLAKAAEQLGSRLIHVSTDYVFDGYKIPPEAYIETDQPNPLSQYGKSKLAGEEAVTQYASQHVILRTAWLYSTSGGNFLKTMLKLAAADPKRELKVVDDQHGSLTWSYSLAEQIKNILHSDINGLAHTTAEGHSTWYEGARYFLDSIGVPYTMRPCTTEEYPTPAHRPANSILENKVLKEAGLSTFKTWQEDIDKYIAENWEQLLAEAS
jgi:dTDP-4-dehydrorhamnose reductase